MTREDPLFDEPFGYRTTKNGLVQISYHGKNITTLSGQDSPRFLSKVESTDSKDAQLVMAKATGHFNAWNRESLQKLQDFYVNFLRLMEIISRIQILCLSLLLPGCMTFSIQGDGEKTPRSDSGTETVHGSLYNFSWSQTPVDHCDNGEGLYRVRFHTNAAYILVSAVSLGLYVPQTLTWWCEDGGDADEDEEEYHPGEAN